MGLLFNEKIELEEEVVNIIFKEIRRKNFMFNKIIIFLEFRCVFVFSEFRFL